MIVSINKLDEKTNANYFKLPQQQKNEITA
jgi:hypothetical protein